MRSGQTPRHQLILAEGGATGLDQRHQNVERAAADLDPPAVDEQFAAMRQRLEAPERDRGMGLGNGLHRRRLCPMDNRESRKDRIKSRQSGELEHASPPFTSFVFF